MWNYCYSDDSQGAEMAPFEVAFNNLVTSMLLALTDFSPIEIKGVNFKASVVNEQRWIFLADLQYKWYNFDWHDAKKWNLICEISSLPDFKGNIVNQLFDMHMMKIFTFRPPTRIYFIASLQRLIFY